MVAEGPAAWAARHQNVRLRPVEERDLEQLGRFDTEPGLDQPYEWKGYRNPHARRRRWELDGYLGADDSVLVVSLPDGAFAGFIAWTAVRRSTPTAPTTAYRIGIALLPEYRNQGLGSEAQCLVADQFFWTTLVNRVEAGNGPGEPGGAAGAGEGRIPEGGDRSWRGLLRGPVPGRRHLRTASLRPTPITRAEHADHRRAGAVLHTSEARP